MHHRHMAHRPPSPLAAAFGETVALLFAILIVVVVFLGGSPR